MRSLRRTTLSIALAIAPLTHIGCANLPARQAAMRAAERTEHKMSTARLEENRGNLVVAKRLYSEIHRQDTRNAECSYRLATVCTRLDQHEEADVYYRQAYAIDPLNTDLLADMGYAALLRKDFARAESFLQEAIRMNPNDRQAKNQLAIALAWQEKDGASLEVFRSICSEDEATQNLAAIRVARNEKPDGNKNRQLTKKATASGINSSSITQTDGTPAATTSTPPEPLPTTPSRVDDPSASSIADNSQAPLNDSASIQTSSQGTSDLAEPQLANRSAELKSNSPPPPAEMPIEQAPVFAEIPNAPLPPLVSVQGLEPVEIADNKSTANPDTNLPVFENPSFPFSEEEREPYTANSSGPSDVQEQTFAEAPKPPEDLQEAAAEQATIERSPSPWRKSTTALRELDDVAPDQSKKPNTANGFVGPQRADGELGFRGICLVTLMEEKRLMTASAEFVVEYQSQQYRFASAKALEKFRLKPEKYVPAAGGLDVVAVRNEQSVVQGSLNFALWHRRRLYLFTSKEHVDAFRRNPELYIPASAPGTAG